MTPPVQAQDSNLDPADVLFMAELAGAAGSSGTGALTLDVVFYGSPPEPTQVDAVLHSALDAGVAVHADQDIAARAWLRASPSSVKRRALPLANGADGLRYAAADHSIHDGPGGTEAPVAAEAPAQDHTAEIAGDAKVVRACRGKTESNIGALAGVAFEKHGQERAIIVKAMRGWCKANDVPLDRGMRLCMSAISKAVAAIKVTPKLSAEDLAASVARGKAAFAAESCVRCHGQNGTGGRRGPDLSDDVWLQCDGSVDAIRRIIISGVPQTKVKGKGRTNGMPAADDPSDVAGLTDLANYVVSLSQK